MLQAIDLTKRYEDGRLALDHVSFRVEPGEIFCLLGPSGAGKSTVINLFLGLIPPTAGRAMVDGIHVEADPVEARKWLAYIPAHAGVYPYASARRNLAFLARLGSGRRWSRQQCYELMRGVGLPEWALESKAGALAPVMRQKLAIALAIARGVPNVLLDDPLAGLDPRSAGEIVKLLVGLREEGRAILMCMPDVVRARQQADRVGILNEGRLVLVRDRRELATAGIEELVADYMGFLGPP